MSQDHKNETFKRLVSSISDEERKSMLEKMHSLAGDPSTQNLDSDDKENPEDIISLEDKLHGESFFYRFLLWLRSVFSNASKEDLYNSDQVSMLYKKINHSFPGLIDYKNGYFLSIFYQKLCELRKAIDFFRPYLDYVYGNIGSFYVFLGSLIAPEVTEQMDNDVDPYKLPLSREVTTELRTSFLRKLDEILKNIPSHRRSYMYSCVTVIEWFYQLSKLPFERFINSFSQGGIDTYSCKFEVVSNDLSAFARILCNGGTVPEEVLTSLYLYSANKIVPSDSTAKSDDERMHEFMDKAAANISMIHMFVKTVPLKALARIAFNNVQWQPNNFTGAEDWFMKYKEQWKCLFDEKWGAWLRDKKKEAIHVRLEEVFGINDFPLMPQRPWTQMWEGIPFHFEYTGGFITWFFDKKYNEVIQPLKVLLLEGSFVNKDNRQEFANTLNDLSELYSDIFRMVDDLSSQGQIGIVFDKITANHLRTLQAQSKIESTMLTIETGIQQIKNSFCNDCRAIKKIVDGALGNKTDTRYDGVANITTINGAQNEKYQMQLINSVDCFTAALDTIKELEPIDLIVK